MNSKFLSAWLFLLPIILPLYVVRFNIGPLPTTLLEIFVLVSFVVWLGVKLLGVETSLAGRLNFSTNRTERRPTRGVSTITKKPTFQRWFWPVIVWLIATLIAVFIAPDKWAALGHWRAFMLEPILVFVMLMDVLGRSKVDEKDAGLDATCSGLDARFCVSTKMLMNGIATVCILLGVYSIIQYFTGWGIPSPWDALPGRRATGIFGFPNGLSLFMAPFGIVCFIEWLRRKSPLPPLSRGFPEVSLDKGRFRGIFFLSAATLAGVAEILAQSMGGMLAMGIGLVLALLINKNTRRVGLAVTVIGLIASGIVGYKILNTQLHPANIGNTIATSKKWSSMVRTVIWQESWQIVKVHPFMGTGLRSYQTAIIPFHKATWMEIYPHPHNIILMLWIETGLLGLLSFIWLCVVWVQAVRKNKNWIWLVPLVVILAHGMVDMPYFKNDLAMQFWILAALASL
ncbi:MAG: O-antigen ligase family protein [Patescibacteria group bacterium]|jgi:hypothetical protein